MVQLAAKLAKMNSIYIDSTTMVNFAVDAAKMVKLGAK